MSSEFDLIVYGATGFTGGLVAEYVARHHGNRIRWAIAGRNEAKLAETRLAVRAGQDVALIRADTDDPATLRDMAERGSVILSTVGPYQLHGSPLIAACVAAGKGYVDLCGEPGWMRAMIDAHETAAKKSNARIVFSCGFDSIPFDAAVERLQTLCIACWGVPAERVAGRVMAMKGGFSGGTLASLKATLAAAARDPSLVKLLASPFALTPGFEGAEQPRMSLPYRDDRVDGWVAPFVMAPINTKNVHRTNALTDFRYGRDFRYDEMVVVPGLGDAARAAAEAIAKANPLSGNTVKQGEGPSAEERESGHYTLRFFAERTGHDPIVLEVTGDRDPGYGSTSKMISEAALLVKEMPEAPGGIWTPAALLGEALVERMEQRAGLTFREVDRVH